MYDRPFEPAWQERPLDFYERAGQQRIKGWKLLVSIEMHR